MLAARFINKGQAHDAVWFQERGEKGGYVHSMYLDCDPPIAGGRELWGFPKKLASPILKVEKDTLEIGRAHV